MQQRKGVKNVKRILSVLVGTVVMAALMTVMAGAALAQAETATFNVRQPESFTMDNPCTGEPILIEGVFHYVVHVTENENGYHVAIRTNSSNVTATGQQTGDKHRAIHQTGVVQGSLINGVFTSNETLDWRFVTTGSSPNYLLHATVKYTFDEDGQPSVVVEKVTAECTPSDERSRG